MKDLVVKEILAQEFEKFSKQHVLRNMFQSVEYANLMSKYDYTPLYVGAFDDGKLIAASLILVKPIARAFKYGYAPRGYLVDFLDSELMGAFTAKLQNFLFKKNIVFVKINPEITYAQINPSHGEKEINYVNAKIMDVIESLGYIKLKDNLYFEAVLPKYNAIINLPEYTEKKLELTIQNRLNRLKNKGLTLKTGGIEDIGIFYNFIKEKKNRSIDYYKDYYNIFNEAGMMDLLFLELNNNQYMITIRDEYEKELSINSELNAEFQKNPQNQTMYNKKMNSDKRINDLNVEIGRVSSKIQNNIQTEILAAALVIKYINRVYIVINGFDKNYSKLSPNYYLYSEIIKKYKTENYKFLDLNGITGDFTDENPYKGLNDFKLSFKPKVFEYIGEFDMVVNKTMYQLLLSSNKLQKEFQRTDIKTINEKIKADKDKKEKDK